MGALNLWPLRAMSLSLAMLAYSVTRIALAEAAEPNVRVVANEAVRKSCHYLGLVTVRKAMGLNKAGGALRKAMRKVADMGGNGLFLINQSQTWTEGASVSGEALLCPVDPAP